MDGKICVITGANSGIGKATALGLAKMGAQVVMVCRNADKGEAARQDIKTASGSQSLDLLIADLSSQAAIHQLSAQLHQRYPAIHVLINNAGVIFTEKQLSVDGIEATLAINYLAPFLLTQLVLDLLFKGAPARIINISSKVYSKGPVDLSDLQFDAHPYHFFQAYAQSKLLLNAMSFELARRLQGKHVTVNCLHPGMVKTNLGHDNPHRFVLSLVGLIGKLFFLSPQAAAKSLLYLATSPVLTDVTGKYFEKGKQVPVTQQAEDPVFAKSLWERSEHLVKGNRL